jgi:hypothetical protein
MNNYGALDSSTILVWIIWMTVYLATKTISQMDKIPPMIWKKNL